MKGHNDGNILVLGKPVIKIDGKHSSKAARRATADVAQGTQRDVFFAQDAKVMITHNLWSEVELVKETRGGVVGNVWAPGEKTPTLAEFIVIRFNGYTRPPWSGDPRYPECVPIATVETS